LLASYFYVDGFLRDKVKFQYRDWVLDSGAFSAHNSGKEIKLQAYIDFCKRIMEQDKTLTEVFALDVIGDAKASLKNTEEMWRQGVPAIPCYHANEPEDFLIGMAKDYPKIALGGVAMQKGEIKHNWAEQCFARIWPKKVHGFAFGSKAGILTVPWHSVDSTNWITGPMMFGRWEKFGEMCVRGGGSDIRSEVKCALDFEDQARVRWQREMMEIGNNGLPATLNVRLAWGTAGTTSLIRLTDAAYVHPRRKEAQPSLDIGAVERLAAPAQPIKKARSSAEIDASEFKYADYWANRGLARDVANLPPLP